MDFGTLSTTWDDLKPEGKADKLLQVLDSLKHFIENSANESEEDEDFYNDIFYGLESVCHDIENVDGFGTEGMKIV